MTKKQKQTTETDELGRAIEHLHNCAAHYRSTETLVEHFEGEDVWEGEVHIFDVTHSDTDTCYAWSSPVEGPAGRRFYAVLKQPPIETPHDAVRTSILADYKPGE